MLAFRAIDYYVFFNVIQMKLSQPRAYDRLVDLIELLFYAAVSVFHLIVCFQDFGILQVNSMSKQLLPMLLLISLLIFLVFYLMESKDHKNMLALESRDMEHFETEHDLEKYINILLVKLATLKYGGKGPKTEQYASSPQVFTIISRHMEHCINDECICKKYEPEFDQKFSTLTSRRLTKGASSTFTSFGGYGGRAESSLFHRRKMPIKISYESKCQIFMAEIADCLERFLASH